MTDILKRNEIYSISIPHESGKDRVVIVANELNIPLLFQKEAQDNMHRLIDKLHNGSFNQVVKNSFRIVNMSWLKQHPSPTKSFDSLSDILQQSKPFTISSNNSSPFLVLDYALAEKISPLANNADNALRLLNLKADIDEEYQRFRHWGDEKGSSAYISL